MRKLITFNFVTMNGYYKGPGGDISWNKHSREESEFAAQGAQSDSILLFGRVTYQMMAAYWPSPAAMQNTPLVADGMNKSEKIVFSRTLDKAEWNNTRLIKENIFEEIRKMKASPGKDMCFLGSGSVISQFAEQGLIDEYQVMVNPVVIAGGTPLFKEIRSQLDLRLKDTRTFKNGNVLLTYQPQ